MSIAVEVMQPVTHNIETGIVANSQIGPTRYEARNQLLAYLNMDNRLYPKRFDQDNLSRKLALGSRIDIFRPHAERE